MDDQLNIIRYQRDMQKVENKLRSDEFRIRLKIIRPSNLTFKFVRF